MEFTALLMLVYTVIAVFGGFALGRMSK